MIILDKKSYALLEYLIALEHAETVMQLSKQLNQSRRKIYYHLEKINDALPEDCEPIVSYPRVGIVLNERQKKVCQDLLAELTDYSYVMSVEERQQLMLAYIAISQEKVTIEKMMQLSDVSRNTILNDLRTIRERLDKEQQEVTLRVTKGQGYYLECSVLVKVQWLYKLFKAIHAKGNAHFQTFMNKQLDKMIEMESYFSSAMVAYLEAYLPILQENLGKKINQQEYQFLLYSLPYMLLSYRKVAIQSVEQASLVGEFEQLRVRKEYMVAQKLAGELHRRFAVLLDEVEVGLIAMLLLSFRKDQDDHLQSRDYAAMRETLQQFIGQLREEWGLRFVSQENLRNQLLTHCKALLYRKTYGILFDNPLTAAIQTQYADLFLATKSCVPILEQAWSVVLTDDEVAYLTIHIGGALEVVPYEPQSRTVMLVCDEGIAVQQLLHQQCAHYLSHMRIEGVMTSEEYEAHRSTLAVDFLITTMQELEAAIPTIVVDPILTDGQIVRLLHIDRGGHAEEFQLFSQHLKQLIQHYIKDAGEGRKLRKAIEKTVYQDLWLDHEDVK